jgi:hypothetical protein
MRSITVAVAVAAALLSQADASEVSLKLDDSAQNALAQLPTLLDSCVAGLTIRGDGSVCRSVGALLVGLGNEVRNAQAAAAAKAAADAAAKKPADATPPQ